MRPFLLAALLGPALLAQAPTSWFPVLQADPAHVEARVVQVDGVPCVQYRNQGKAAVHFQAWVDGVQTREQGLASPRIHLNLHQRSAFIPLPAGVVHPTFKVGLIRSGADRGAWALE